MLAQPLVPVAFIMSPTWKAVRQTLCMMPLHSSQVCLQWSQQVTDAVVRLFEGVSNMACSGHARLNLLNHAMAFLAASKSAHPQVLLVCLCHSNAAVIAYISHQSCLESGFAAFTHIVSYAFHGFDAG